MPTEPELFNSVVILLEVLMLRLILGLPARDTAGEPWNGTGGETASRAASVIALCEDEGRLWERERERRDGEVDWPDEERFVITGFLRRPWKRT